MSDDTRAPDAPGLYIGLPGYMPSRTCDVCLETWVGPHECPGPYLRVRDLIRVLEEVADGVDGSAGVALDRVVRRLRGDQ